MLLNCSCSQRWDKKINPAYDNNWCIKCASHNGHFNVVKLLLEDKRVNPADENNCAIQWASLNGHYNVVKLFLFTTMR